MCQGPPPQPGFKAVEVMLGKGIGVGVDKSGPPWSAPWALCLEDGCMEQEGKGVSGGEVRKELGHADPPGSRERPVASQASWLREGSKPLSLQSEPPSHAISGTGRQESVEFSPYLS